MERYDDKGLKKTKKFTKPVNEVYLKEMEDEKEMKKTDCRCGNSNALEAEMDEIWIFYHDKSDQVTVFE